MAPLQHDAHLRGPHSSGIAARSASTQREDEDRISLFGDLSDGKKRKFILVEDPAKNQRVRVRVTLDTVDINEIPDSFRKSNSVFPRSWFPLQMQDPPPSSRGSKFFEGDDQDSDDDVDVGNGGVRNGRKRRGRTMVRVPLADGGEAEVATPRMRRSIRSKEVRINELGYRMTWHQSRVFADKTVFLQKACEFSPVLSVGLHPLLCGNKSTTSNEKKVDSYRLKMKQTLEGVGQDLAKTPHFETRVGKRRWNERSKRERKDVPS